MELEKYERCRLYDLSEIQIEGIRHYERASFPDDLSDDCNFNGDFSEDNLSEALDCLADATYGGDNCCHWFEITNDLHDGKGKFRIKTDGGACLEIQDITHRIRDLSEDTWLFILVDKQLTKYKWVVADPKGTVYSG